jgi:hypothetical protein|tara:strand:- start:1155 stop:1439 length:285 start_codon:yes stop_codon:yes gene_type:complete
MKKYIVTKKCYANEFVSVIAETEEEALLKAMDNDCKSLGNNLEFGGYRDRDDWQIEELPTQYFCADCSDPTSFAGVTKYNCDSCGIRDEITGEH